MESIKVNAIITQYKDMIPANQVLMFKNMLTNASDDVYDIILTVPMKNPTTTLMLSLFLGGVGADRFYLGETGVGITKLLFGWLTFGIWPLVDIFVCYKKAKEINLQNLLQLIK